MTHFKQIYSTQAQQYHHMITHEDRYDNLLPAIEQVTPIAGKHLLDLGTGTGRLPLLLAKQSRSMVGLDLYRAMLQENQRQQALHQKQWMLIQGSVEALPLPTANFEVVTCGWVIGHLAHWFEDSWRNGLANVLQEMHRVTISNGAIIIMETLSTGSLHPVPPTSRLADYYGWLEGEWGFTRQTIRTDYEFGSVEEAIKQTEFFFGSALSKKIQAQGWAQLPEWTGVWSKRLR